MTISLIWALIFTVALVVAIQSVIVAFAQDKAASTYETKSERERAHVYAQRFVVGSILDSVTAFTFAAAGIVPLPSARVPQPWEDVLILVLLFIGGVSFVVRLIATLYYRIKYEDLSLGGNGDSEIIKNLGDALQSEQDHRDEATEHHRRGHPDEE